MKVKEVFKPQPIEVPGLVGGNGQIALVTECYGLSPGFTLTILRGANAGDSYFYKDIEPIQKSYQGYHGKIEISNK